MVRAIAEAVERKIGLSKVFIDKWFPHLFNGYDGDLRLQEIFGERCGNGRHVPSAEYGKKEVGREPNSRRYRTGN